MKNAHFRWTCVAQKRLCLSSLLQVRVASKGPLGILQLLCWGRAIMFVSFDVVPSLKVFYFLPFPPFGKNNSNCARFHWLAVWRCLGRCHWYGCHSYALHSAVALVFNSLSVALLRAHLCWWFLHDVQNANTCFPLSNVHVLLASWTSFHTPPCHPNSPQPCLKF